MTARTLLCPLLLSAVAGVIAFGAADAKSHKLQTVSLRKMADSLHAVIAADRLTYAEFVVQRLDAQEGRLRSVTNWREAHALPVHAQMLRSAAQRIQRQGAEFSYNLRSLWPIDPANGPQTAVEQTGLEWVFEHPDEPYYTEEMLGGRSYFTAIYPDRATLSSCADCHNREQRSPRRDFGPNDIMGGIVVRVPLEF